MLFVYLLPQQWSLGQAQLFAHTLCVAPAPYQPDQSDHRSVAVPEEILQSKLNESL